jgi:subtilase family serine protease
LFIFFESSIGYKRSIKQSGIDPIPDALWWSPHPVKEGDAVAIGFRVKNIGTQSTGHFHLQVKRDGTPICGWDVPGLAPNQVFERGPGIGGATCSGSYGIPSAQAAGYNISLPVDDLNKAGESNEGNNTLIKYGVVSK